MTVSVHLAWKGWISWRIISNTNATMLSAPLQYKQQEEVTWTVPIHVDGPGRLLVLTSDDIMEQTVSGSCEFDLLRFWRNKTTSVDLIEKGEKIGHVTFSNIQL